MFISCMASLQCMVLFLAMIWLRRQNIHVTLQSAIIHNSISRFIWCNTWTWHDMTWHDMGCSLLHSPHCTLYWRTVLTIKHFFLNPFWLHDIVEQTLWCDSPFFFITFCFLRELIFNRALCVELLEIEEWINPSLRVRKKKKKEKHRIRKIRNEPKRCWCCNKA